MLIIKFATKIKIKNRMAKEILHKILKDGIALDINAV